MWNYRVLGGAERPPDTAANGQVKAEETNCGQQRRRVVNIGMSPKKSDLTRNRIMRLFSASDQSEDSHTSQTEPKKQKCLNRNLYLHQYTERNF